MNGVLALDFEGTLTEENFLPSIVTTFGGQKEMGNLNYALRSGALSLQALLEQQFGLLTVPLTEVVTWTLANVRMQPGLHELVEAARDAHLEIVVVSGAFCELIVPLLEREGIALDVRGPHVDARSDGWRVLWPEAVCSECGERCKRMLLPKRRPLFYVGDGRSDRCPARLADRLFAKDELATYVNALRLPYTPFRTLFDVARSLN